MTLLFPVIVSALMLIIDQITKIIVINNMDYLESIPFINGVLSFYRINNDGAGFSILSGKTAVLIGLTVVALVIISLLVIKGTFKSKLSDYGFLLVISGGLGNLIDRIFRGGQVVDFIKTDFIDFPIFNVADICVTVGAGLLILHFIIEAVNERKHKKNNENS